MKIVVIGSSGSKDRRRFCAWVVTMSRSIAQYRRQHDHR